MAVAEVDGRRNGPSLRSLVLAALISRSVQPIAAVVASDAPDSGWAGNYVVSEVGGAIIEILAVDAT